MKKARITFSDGLKGSLSPGRVGQDPPYALFHQNQKTACVAEPHPLLGFGGCKEAV
ncbi:hypothetical protein HMPREF9123_0638 [Neisseria bacilliformis ATCC BAA-1200]|uniref:Uncharacterized protein n=1 Tax=Neisseria bacilliformis ATCC BAA-1200 TaxID=888742 RepID=F2BAG6_9NEIS|nr:hypothetical protein [Neisseria bacilliformis]EGF11522.1 hypothetical protein HMPREF9123_0638 [Neisseria bacilliformis ATCC BAA-1200]QMT47844.1 hypothetical protein H3L91_01490 [Neisseria bacilliformis]